ncbi:MAG: hypothetical protein CMM12_10850 [Rhodospirillaceae bacterium]|nr:hypothetical protein [Rhodospirillaceae bacterium]
MSDWQGSVVRRSTLLLALVVPGFLGNFGLMLLAANLLPAPQFGVFYLATALISVLTAPTLMLAFYISRTTAAEAAKGEDRVWRAIPGLIALVGRRAALAAFAVLVVLVLIGLALDITSMRALVMVMVVVWLTVMSDTARGLLQGLQKFHALGLLTTGHMMARLAFGVMGIALFSAAWGGLAGIAIATAFAAFVLPAVALRRMQRKEVQAARLAPDRMMDIAPFAISYGLTLFACWADVIVAYLVLDRATLGVYAASSVLPKALLTATLPVLQVAFPVAVNATSSRTPDHTPPLARTLGITLLIGVTGILFVLALQDTLCGGHWGIRLCRPDWLLPLFVATLAFCLVRAIAVVQLGRARDLHPVLLTLPVVGFVAWVLLSVPDGGKLVNGSVVFAIAALVWYAAFLRPNPNSPSTFATPVRVAAINLLVLGVLFGVGELGARVYGQFFVDPTISFRAINFAERLNTSLRAGSLYPATPDPLLGYIPKPGRHTSWDGSQVTVNPDSTRSNGAPPLRSGSSYLLAVGDSFTWGDQVSDRDTWTAVLERRLSLPIRNGGVFGYGIGQSYLRAKTLIESGGPPDVLLFGLTPDNIERTALAFRTGVVKPTFHLLRDDRLALTDVSENEAKYAESLSLRRDWLRPVRSALGYSFLLHNVLNRVFPEYWLSNRFSVSAHDDGLAVSCALMSEIAKLPVTRKIIVVQYPAHLILAGARPEKLSNLLHCMWKAGLQVVDTFDPLSAVFDADKAAFADFYVGHMSPAGNQFIADQLEPHLRSALPR